VVYSNLDGRNADEVIRAQVRYFEALGQGFEWKLYDHDRPPDLKERLAAFGFQVGDAEAIMVLALDDAPEFFWQPVSHDVRRVTRPEAISDLLAVNKQVWGGDPAWMVRYMEDALRDHPEQISAYVAYVDGQPASAARVEFPEGSQFASFWGGGTVPRFRKRGLYSALLAIRAQEARERGRTYLTVDAGEMSRPILERLGFQVIAYSYPCDWPVAAQG
jgi:GNAT superfamily N-acetyltransferase